MASPVVVIELNKSIALTTDQRELDLPHHPLHLPPVVGKLLAQRTPFGHPTRTYADYIYDYRSTSTPPAEYVKAGEVMGSMRPSVLNDVKVIRTAVTAQAALVFQSFHDFIHDLKKQQATVVMRYAPSVHVEPIIQELEFFHGVNFTRGHFKGSQLYYDKEAVEMKEALDEGFHVWQDEEDVVPIPKSIPSVTFTTRSTMERGTWRDPITSVIVTTLRPRKEMLLAQARGDLVVIDRWRALVEPRYFQQAYQAVLVFRSDPDDSEKVHSVAREQLDTHLQQYLMRALENLHTKRDYRSDALWEQILRGVSPVEQSQFYLLLREYIQGMYSPTNLNFHQRPIDCMLVDGDQPFSASASSFVVGKCVQPKVSRNTRMKVRKGASLAASASQPSAMEE